MKASSHSKMMPPAKTHRQIKREKGASHYCSTPGSEKSENCKASQFDKAMSKRNRSHKMKEYPSWAEKMLLKFKKYS